MPYIYGGGHMYMTAGLRFDTSGSSGAGTGWQPAGERSGRGYAVVHPVGF